MLSAGGGGQSWLVGKSPSTMVVPGVQTSPSFGPPWHLLLVPLQIGQGWMKVRQVLLGQSASVMQPLPAFVPATHAPVSQVPVVHSPSEQQGEPYRSPDSRGETRVRPANPQILGISAHQDCGCDSDKDCELYMYGASDAGFIGGGKTHIVCRDKTAK